MKFSQTRSVSMSGRFRVAAAVTGVIVAVLTGCQPREGDGAREVRSAAPSVATSAEVPEIPQIPTPAEGSVSPHD